MNSSFKSGSVSASRRLVWCLLGVLMLVATLGSARAQTTITIINPSFEIPVVGSGADAPAGNWDVLNGSSGAGVFYPVSPGAPDGTQVAYANSGVGLIQFTGVAIQANVSYTLSGNIGRRVGESNPQASMGAIQIGSSDGTAFHAFGSLNLDISTGTFSAVTGSFVPTSDYYGETLAVVVLNTGDAQVLFDNIHLTATAIPEPATYVAWAGAAALGAALYRRRRRATVAGA